MVEFAIILPLMVLLLLGITELGRALYDWNTLTKAVATGARYMARSNGGLVNAECGEGETWDTFEDLAKKMIVYGKVDGTEPLLKHLNAGAITISPHAGTGSFAGTCVIEVQAVVDFDWMLGSFLFEIAPVTLTARTEERYIGE